MQLKIKFPPTITIYLYGLIVWYDVQNDSLTVTKTLIPTIIWYEKQTHMQNN